jgi:PhzF family phenazine biosynthesis protein
MKLLMYQVDAFTDHLFGGNPAAVCALNEWIPDQTMQLIAMENNLAETAFFVRKGDTFHIRWFTPLVEVDLCGHATLASAYVLFERLGFGGEKIHFTSRSGDLFVTRNGDLITLDFPTDTFTEETPPQELMNELRLPVVASCKGKTDWLFLLNNRQEIEDYQPDWNVLSKFGSRGVILTAQGDEVDFVSRFFAPKSGIPEDPVTGSAHTTLAPFWAGKLGKSELTAIQLSKRKGKLWCKVLGDRVEISGNARIYMTGEVVYE